MSPSINWNTPINFQNVGLSTKNIYINIDIDNGEIPTSIAELCAACVSSVQSGIMHNATPRC